MRTGIETHTISGSTTRKQEEWESSGVVELFESKFRSD